MSEKLERNTFTTSAGVVVYYIPPSATIIEMSDTAIMKQYKDAGRPVEIPTYTVELAGGGSQTFEHNETTLVTDEHKAEWAAHKEAITDLNAELGKRRLEIVLDAIQVELPKDESWKRKQKKWGLEIPEPEDGQDYDNPDYLDQLRYHYIRTEILRTPIDVENATVKIISAAYAGSVDEEELAAQEATFRSILRQTQPAKVSQEEVGGDQDPGPEGRVVGVQ